MGEAPKAFEGGRDGAGDFGGVEVEDREGGQEVAAEPVGEGAGEWEAGRIKRDEASEVLQAVDGEPGVPSGEPGAAEAGEVE